MLSNCRSARIAYATLTMIVTPASMIAYAILTVHCYFCLDEVMEKSNALNDSIKIKAEKRTMEVVSIAPLQI